MKKINSIILMLVLGMSSLSLAIEDPWKAKADMPTARIYLSTSVVNGKIYAISGAKRREQSIPTVEEYNPATDVWTTKSSIPTSRWGFGASAVNGKIYAIGGAEGHPMSSLNTVEEYDPVTDTWTTKSPMPTARWGLSTSVVNGKIYAIGGGIPTAYRAVEEYDPVTDTWTKKASIPVGRYAISTCAVNGKIYAIGGVVSYPTITPRVHEYNPTTDTWATKADMLTARAYPATSVVNGKIYAMGGTKIDPDSPPLTIVEVYDPMRDTWTRDDDMPTARTMFSTSVVNGKIYAIGGEGGGSYGRPVLATVEEYDPYPYFFDLNRDQKVDCADMCIMVNYLGTNEPFCDIAPDLGDGIVDAQDIIFLTQHMFEDYRAIAQWKLDESDGEIAYDNVGGFDAMLHGSPIWQSMDGKLGGALEFQGIEDYVSTPFVINPQDGSLTVSAWIKGGVPGQVIISQVGDFGGNWLGINDSGDFITGFSDQYFGSLESEAVITDGQWHHVGLVYDSGVFHRLLYVDGVLVAKDATVVSGMPSDGGLYIGAGKDLDATKFFSGLIDDVRIYNMALNSDEIAELSH